MGKWLAPCFRMVYFWFLYYCFLDVRIYVLQCRQKTRDFVASCKNKKDDKLCSINFCHKCLLNRFGLPKIFCFIVFYVG